MAVSATLLAACLLSSAQIYHVPAAVMIGILHVEQGHVGQAAGPNTNGTYDLGPMQINTSWMPTLAHYWHVDQRTAYYWVRDNGCVNMYVSAWILRQSINQAGGYLPGGIARYHSATPEIGGPYARRVIMAMSREGLIDYSANASEKLAER